MEPILDGRGQGRSCWIQMLNSVLQSLCDWLMQALNIHISKSVRFFSAVQLLLACVCRVDCRRCRTQAGNHLVTDARFGQEGFSKSVRFFLLHFSFCLLLFLYGWTQAGTCVVTDAGDGEGGFLGSAKEPRFRGKRRNAHDWWHSLVARIIWAKKYI